MNQKSKSLEHTLNVIRRQVADEYPELTLHFITSAPKTPPEATKDTPSNDNLYALPDHPAKEAMLNHLKKHPPTKTTFAGAALTKKTNIPFWRNKDKFLAVCYINIQDMAEQNEHLFPTAPEKHQRLIGYSLAWKAIDLYLKYKQGQTDSYNLNNEDLLTPIHTLANRLRANLISECFAAMLMEQQGDTGTIPKLMKKRSHLCLNKIEKTTPELHPFPISYDATRLVFNDLQNKDPDKTQLLAHTLFMADEIDGTCDDIILKQWREFCYATQEMAWMDRSRNEILSAATYSSDDPHMRTTAYIIAEALNTDVTPLNNPQYHNPFADQEKYERLHKKTALTMFEQLIITATQEGRPELLMQQALQQNTRLLAGDIIGWCAPALIKTCNAYSKEDIRIELLQELFANILHDTKWSDICKLNRFIMLKKRQSIPITSDVITNEFVRNKSELSPFKEAFTAI